MGETAQPVIETRSLVKVYGLLPALRRLDMQIGRGEFVALLGPNGSGKSTLLRLLTGLSKPTAGAIFIGGWEMPAEAAAVRAQIGLVSHKAILYEMLTARENLRFFARLYNLPQAQRDARINTILERVGLGRRADHLVRTYSRGMLQRLSIARALLHDPHVLLLDEPYTGLDQDASATLDGLVREAHMEGRTILMATHDLERAARLASRIVVLSRGTIAHDGPTSGLNAVSLAGLYSDVTGMATAR